MTCNLVNHEAALLAAVERVRQDEDQWAIFEYETGSNIIKVGKTGDGGLEALIQEFDSSKVQYGFAAIEGSEPRKIILIHWQGEAVPALRLAQLGSHLEEVKRAAKTVGLAVRARTADDLEPAELAERAARLAGQARAGPYVPPAPAHAPRPAAAPAAVEREQRERFWLQLRAEEEQRLSEEAKKREEQQKQFELERRILEKELHQASLAAKAALLAAKDQPAPAPAPKPPKKNSLVSGRAQMFDEKVAELAKSTTTPNRPKQFKFEVALQPKNPPPPVNANLAPDEAFIPVVEDRPVAKVVPQLPSESQPAAELVKDREEPEKKPPSEQCAVVRALTLWDYTADDNTEISFDPNCVITDIEQLYEGWWRGRTPDGQVGLFPSNYVKLLQ